MADSVADLRITFEQLKQEIEARQMRDDPALKASLMDVYRAVDGSLGQLTRLKDDIRDLVEKWKARRNVSPAMAPQFAGARPVVHEDHIGASTFLERGWSKISLVDYDGVLGPAPLQKRRGTDVILVNHWPRAGKLRRHRGRHVAARLPFLDEITDVVLQSRELSEGTVDSAIHIHQRGLERGIVAHLARFDLLLQLLEGDPKIGYAVSHSSRSSETIPVITFAIIDNDTTWSAPASSNAARGIPYIADDASSWTIARPPADLIFRSPAAPSRPIPVSTTPVQPAPNTSAAESKSTSAHGVAPERGSTERCVSVAIPAAPATAVLVPPRAIYTTPAESGIPSSASHTLMRLVRARRSAIAPVNSAGKCCAITTAAGRVAGSWGTISASARGPPVEDATTTSCVAATRGSTSSGGGEIVSRPTTDGGGASVARAAAPSASIRRSRTIGRSRLTGPEGFLTKSTAP